MKDFELPSNVEQWLSLFRRFINARKQDAGFVGDKYFITIGNNIDNLTADEICMQISKACENFFGINKVGREVIGRNLKGTSVLLCKEDEYPAFLRFVEQDGLVVDMGISEGGSKRYQFYRDSSCNIQYHNERFGGTLRRFSTPYDDEKFYNPDGSRDWGRGIRDLWESFKKL